MISNLLKDPEFDTEKYCLVLLGSIPTLNSNSCPGYMFIVEPGKLVNTLVAEGYTVKVTGSLTILVF